MGSLQTAASPVIDRARTLIQQQSEDTGALRRSMGVRVRKMGRSGVIMALIGPRRRTYIGGFSAKRGRGGALRKPSKYAHLVEFGHRITRHLGRRINLVRRSLKLGTAQASGRSVAGRPFMEPAFRYGVPLASVTLLRGFDRALTAEWKRAKARFEKNQVFLK